MTTARSFTRLTAVALALGIFVLLSLPSASATLVDLYVGSNTPNQTTNFTSGTHIYSSTYVGYTTNASNNLLTVSGAGALLTNAELLFVGYDGSGNSLVISNGGQVVATGTTNPSTIEIGQNSDSSNNSILVTGSNSLLSTPNYINIGLAGSGSLTISNGGTVSDLSGVIANQSNSSGSVVVTGGLWNNSSNLVVGNSATGSLTISGAGTVTDANGYIGNATNSSNNSVLVTGTNSLWSNSSDLYVGNYGSSNSLVISNGAAVSVGNYAVAGRETGSSNNSVFVTGGSSSLTVEGAIFDIGFSGTGNRLVISNGGTVSILNTNNAGAGGSSIGSFANSNSVLVTGASSLLTNAGIYYVGFAGSYNELTVSSNGAFVSGSMTVGDTGNSNSVTVSDAGSLSIEKNLTIGNDGSGNSLVISHGGLVADSNGIVGNNSNSSNNSVLVTGSNSLWTNGADLFVGYQGGGNTLSISNGGQVADSYAYIGHSNSSSNNAATVTGSNSVWTNSSFLTVGDNGAGNSLVISNGGSLVDAGGVIGNQATSSNNAVLVTGAGSLWSNNGLLFIAAGSGNSLTVTNGGAVVATYLGIQQGADSTSNTVIITGSNSQVLISGLVEVGSSASLSGDQLLISTGGSLISSNGIVGTTNGAAQGNSVQITDSGSSWKMQGDFLFANGSGSNSLMISGGAQLANSNGYIGLNGSSNNTATVTGNNSLWTNGHDFYVGYNGSSNSLLISGGAQVLVQGRGYIGSTNYAASFNSVLLTGSNSLWVNGNGVVVGGSGSGNTLVVSDAATLVSSNKVRMGYLNTSSNNSVTVNGGFVTVGSTEFDIGYGGSGNSLIITNGGKVTNANGLIGVQGTSSNNSVLVTGAGSLWTNNASLIVGVAGNGTLTIGSGGTVAATNLVIAGTNGAAGTFNYGTLGGSETGMFLVTPTITFGSGTGVLNFNQSDTVTFSGVISGGTNSDLLKQLGSGTTILSGSNTYSADTIVEGGDLIFTGSLSNSSTITVGQSNSSASLVISNAQVWNSNSYVGYSTNSSNNSVLVTGSASLWSNSGSLSVGYAGSSNRLTISGGASVFDVNGALDALIAPHSSNNSALVTGTGSLWSNSANLYVGSSGSGNELTISGGGHVVDSNGYIDIAISSSNNSVLVTGTGSLWSNETSLYVGYGGNDNKLTVTNGGHVIDTTGFIDGLAGGDFSNSVVVTGTNSLWSNSGDLIVGNAGYTNSLTISNGGQVFNAAGTIGSSNTASNNSVVVFGTGSLWNNSNDLHVGDSGSGNSLVISNGGQVADNYGYLGYNAASSNNSALITGAGSLWTNAGDLTVGNYGSGNSLTISGGATVANANGYLGYGIGFNSTNNSVLVTGANSLWSNSGDLLVGNFGGDNSLVASNSGTVLNSNAIIGNQSTSSNDSVLLTGSGSLWNNSGLLTVGNFGGGTLTVANGGSVSATGITIANQSGSTGTLNIGTFGGSDSAGTLVTPTITFGSGTGAINFNQSDSTTLTSSISGRGVVQQLGLGTTIFSGNNSYSGSTWIRQGTAVAASTNAFGGSAVFLGNVTDPTLRLATNLTVSSFYWGTNGVIAMTPGSQLLTITNTFYNNFGTNSVGGGLFDFGGATESTTNPITLITFGAQSGFNTNNFSVLGSTNWGFILTGSTLQTYYLINGLIAKTSVTTVDGTGSYPQVTFQTNGVLNITPTGNLTITGNVNVTNNGTVNLAGILTTPTLTVFTGGKLTGTGTLNGGLVNSGTLLPGTGSTGTLTVNGNFTQSAGGSFILQASSGNQYNHLQVNGSTTLGGTLIVTGVGGYGLNFGDKYTFLNSASSISGNFSVIDIPAPYRARVVIAGDPTATLIIAPQSYTTFAQNQNQTNVARALNSFIPATSGDQLLVSTALDSLTASQYNAAFNAIEPTLYQSLSTIAFNLANAQNSELVQRLWGLRVAGTGFSMTGFAENTFIPQGQEGKGVLDAKKDILRPGEGSHWGMFVDGNGIFAVANSANMLPNYNSQSGGVTTGLTYKWNEAFGTGIYAGYEGSYAKYPGVSQGSTSRLIDNSVRFGLFGTYGQPNGKGFYADALAGGGYNNYQVSRNISFGTTGTTSGINRTANSTPGAGELDTMLAGGYDVKKGNWTFGPTTSLQYTYFGANSVNETGAQSLDFNSGGWNTSSLLYSLGAHAAYTWQANKDIVVVPQVSLSWQHEFMQNPYSINGTVGGSPSFANTSSAPLRDTLYTGVGFTVEFAKKWNTSLFYNASAGNQNLVSENIFWSAGVKF